MADDNKQTAKTSSYESLFAGNPPGVFVGRYGEPEPAPMVNMTPDLRKPTPT